MVNSKSFDPTKPVQFRNRPNMSVRVVITDRDDPTMKIGALYKYNDKEGEGLMWFRADGTAISGDKDKDLVNVAKRTSKFENIWSSSTCGRGRFDTIDVARSSNGNVVTSKRLGILELKFEDDVLVDVALHPATA
jgi:hypothetical protein